MEIKSNLPTGPSPLDTSAATETRRTHETRAKHYGAAGVNHPSVSGADNVELSASARLELDRGRRLEALETAVQNGTYQPNAKAIASGIVDTVIFDSTEPK